MRQIQYRGTLADASEQLLEQTAALDELAQRVAFGQAGLNQIVERVDDDLDAKRIRMGLRLVVDDASLDRIELGLFLPAFRIFTNQDL